MTTSYTARPQAVTTRRPWLSYTGAWNTALGELSLEYIAARYAGCRTILCPPSLSGQRKRLVSFSFYFCTHATARFWFRLVRVHPTLLGWKVVVIVVVFYYFTRDLPTACGFSQEDLDKLIIRHGGSLPDCNWKQVPTVSGKK